jgi:hypothetical protein
MMIICRLDTHHYLGSVGLRDCRHLIVCQSYWLFVGLLDKEQYVIAHYSDIMSFER